MKNAIYALLFLAVMAQSCKKESIPAPAPIENESSSFYPIGTVVKISDNVIIPGQKPQNSSSDSTNIKINNKTSYLPGYNPTWYQSFALGTYDLATPTIAKSYNNIYTLVFQTDGNLVLYKNGTQALWASGNTYVITAAALSQVRFQGDGNIVHIYDWTTGYVTWSAGVTAGPNPIWVLQDDGNLVGYSNHTNNGDGSLTITGSAFGSTGTAGGKVSTRPGKIK